MIKIDQIQKPIGSYPSPLAALADVGVVHPDLLEWAADPKLHPLTPGGDYCATLAHTAKHFVQRGDTFKTALLGVGKLYEKLASLTTAERQDPTLRNRDNTIHLLHSFAEVLRCGSHHFKPTRPLVEKMILTNTDIGWEDLHLPFAAFSMELPSKIFRIESAGVATSIVEVLVAPPLKDQCELHLCLYGFTQAGVLIGFNHTLRHAPTISASLQYSVSDCPDNNRWQTTAPRQQGEEAHLAILSTVMNLILYLSTQKTINKTPNLQARKIYNKIPKLSGRVREEAIKRLEFLQLFGEPYVVGTHVTIDSKLRDVAHQAAGGRTISVASYVRGHLRNQACGEKHTLRKIIWIEPHWRGLLAEKVSQKTYKVQTNNTPQ